MVRGLASLALLLFPLLAGAGEKLDTHERELLLARLEDLAGRLAAAQDDRLPDRLGSRQGRLEVELEPQRGRTLAGVVLERTAVTLKGRPELVLVWLGKIPDSRSALTPPCSLRALEQGFELQLAAWRVRGQRPDPQAPDDELIKLRENLEWFEKRRESLAGYVALLQPLLDAEAVLVSAARLRQDTLTITAQACDRAAREAFTQELARRAAQFSKSTRLDLRGLTVRPEKPVSGAGLHARDLDPADALLLCCRADQAQVIAAWNPGPPLSAHVAPGEGAGPAGPLLDPLLERLELPARRLGALVVASDRLRGKPPDAGMLPQRPISLQFGKVSPQNLFILLSKASRVGVIPPASGQALTVLVRDLPLRNLASAALWALGLVPAGDNKLMAMLPPGREVPAVARGEADRVELSAADAPMSRLVDALAGRPGVIACREDPPLTLRVRDVAGNRLLALLLAGQGQTLRRSGGKTLMLPAGADPGACRTKPEIQAADRLYAVLRGKKKSVALLNDGGRLRWVAEGESLGDGRELRRIRSSRAVLRGPGGRLISLVPHPEPDCAGAGCAPRFDPTGTPLARFRLAGTAESGKRAAAALVDAGGQVHIMHVGQLLGRRCGRITRIAPGRIEVEMECGQEYDPRAVWLSLRPD